jgi:hypothetical protein
MTVVQTVEQATQLAIDFARKYYSFVYPIGARKENSRWVVDLDISSSPKLGLWKTSK